MDNEGTLVEIFTAACLFLASLLLFATAKLEKARIRRCAYLLGGLAMAFCCGEEVNWGQHVFDFATPNFVAEWNYNKEFNVHNTAIGGFLLRLAHEVAPLLLSILTCGALFSRKDNILGIPLPSVPLMLSFLLIIYPEYLIPDTRLWSIFSGPGVLLMTAFLFMLFSRQVRHSAFTAALLTMPAAALYASYRCDCNVWYIQDEILECLLALACLCYAAELCKGMDGQRRSITASGGPLRGLAAAWKARVQGLPPPWLTASILMVAASFGLAASAHLALGSTKTTFSEDLRKLQAGKPIIRSKFDVHFMDEGLIYFREPCTATDTWGQFFVHIYYTDPDDLPGSRTKHGFDRYDFTFPRKNGVILDGKCLVKRRIHSSISAISRIRTGQRLAQDQLPLWEGEFFSGQSPEPL